MFYRKKDASEYIITDEEFQFVLKYDGDPIVPPTSDDLLKEKQFQHDYNGKLEQMSLMDKNCGDFSKNIMMLAEECNSMKMILEEMKEKRRATETLISKINGTRIKSKQAMHYWKNVDPLVYGKWLCLIHAADIIMSRVDCTKELPGYVIDNDQPFHDISDISTSTNIDTKINDGGVNASSSTSDLEMVDYKSSRFSMSCSSIKACSSDTNVKLFSRTCILTALVNSRKMWEQIVRRYDRDATVFAM